MREKVTVHYAEGTRELAQQLVGRDFTDEELAAATGALDGAIVKVRISRSEVLAEIEHPTSNCKSGASGAMPQGSFIFTTKSSSRRLVRLP